MEKIIVIDGIETHYSISDSAEVRNVITGKILKHKINDDGYHSVKLYINGKRVYKFVHVLVAIAFIPNPDNLPQVNHKDGVHNHNTPDNLEWCTPKYNVQHSIINGFSSRLKLSVKDVLTICQLMETGEYTQNQLAIMFGVPRHVITSIKNKQSWTLFSEAYNVDNCKVEWNLTPNDKVYLICKLICENELMLDEIAERVGVSHSVVCDIYHKRNFKSIVNQFDFSGYDKYQRYDKEFLETVQSLIIQGNTNAEIRQLLSLDNCSRINMMIYRQRRKVGMKR